MTISYCNSTYKKKYFHFAFNNCYRIFFFFSSLSYFKLLKYETVVVSVIKYKHIFYLNYIILTLYKNNNKLRITWYFRNDLTLCVW